MEKLTQNNAVGILKFDGKLIVEGAIDLKTAGESLIGLNEALNFFIKKEHPEFNEIELEIPVQIRKGSWEAIISEIFTEHYWKIASVFLANKYLGTALGEMAKHDFKNIGFTDLIKKSFKGIIWTIKIAKHLGSLSVKLISDILVLDDSKPNEIGISDSEGVILWVPVDALDFYKNCPDTLFFKMTKNIEIERDLTITYSDENENISSTISNTTKPIFFRYKDTKETFLFPELVHGEIVEIKGRITRGNENANTLGLSYKRHILTLVPVKGNIVSNKGGLFSECTVIGKVDRMNRTGTKLEKKPKIIYTEIIPIES
tara:strand:+ start:31 stop:978 length:948 start_codon:yes stop_codon:yes gene_type:complete